MRTSAGAEASVVEEQDVQACVVKFAGCFQRVGAVAGGSVKEERGGIGRIRGWDPPACEVGRPAFARAEMDGLKRQLERCWSRRKWAYGLQGELPLTLPEEEAVGKVGAAECDRENDSAGFEEPAGINDFDGGR